MGRGAYGLVRVAVLVRAPAGWLWWPGLLAAALGLLVPGLTGRRIGGLVGIAAFLVAAALVAPARRRRYTGFATAATRAGKAVVLQDRAVTLRGWRRAHRRRLLAAFAVAVGSSFAVPTPAGLLMAGAGLGFWAKARWIGEWEHRHEALLWVRPEWAARRGPAGPDVRGYLTTGPAAGDAAPGGGPARAAARARAGRGTAATR